MAMNERQKFTVLPRSVTAVPSEAQHGETIEAHSHPWVQLLYASEGVMRVRTEHGVWIVPPRRTLGYASPSAFTSMFRRLLGRTPQHYVAEWRGR